MKATVQKTITHRGLTPRRVGASKFKIARKTSRRGFASMDPLLQKRIARQGGRSVSRDRKHMAEIGRIGGARRHTGKKR